MYVYANTVEWDMFKVSGVYCFIMEANHLLKVSICTWCNVAALLIETGWCENIREEDQRCPVCKNVVKEDMHVVSK